MAAKFRAAHPRYIKSLQLSNKNLHAQNVRLVIIDPHVSGHHSAYIRRIVEGATARGIDCLVITSEAPAGNLEFSRLNQPAGARVEWVAEKLRLPALRGTGTISLLFRQFVFWRYFRKVTHLRLDPARDRVLAPYLDDCSYAIALLGSPFGSTPWAGISMRAIFHFADVGINGTHRTLTPGKQKYLFEHLARDPYLVRLFFIDETVLSCRSMSATLRGKSRYLPDPSDPPSTHLRAIARTELGVEQTDFVILIYGAISKRKGFVSLLSVLATPNLAPNVRALIVGQFDQDCREEFAMWLDEDIQRRKRVIFVDKYVNSDMEARCLSACDIVWLAYHDHLTMSGVLVQAGLNSKPILGSNLGLIGWYINTKRLGITLPQTDAAISAIAISQLASNREALCRYGERCHSTFIGNTVQVFQETIFRNLFDAGNIR